MMQTAILILAGYIVLACAITVLQIGLSLQQQRSDTASPSLGRQDALAQKPRNWN
jgi:hypothetical protein